MGNCLRCFQGSTSTSTTLNTNTEQTGVLVQGATGNLSRFTINNTNNIAYTTTASVNSSTLNTEGRYGGVGIGLGLGGHVNEHQRRSIIFGEHSHETEELLAPNSPLKIANNCDTKQNSFKKTLVRVNGSSSVVMGDVITTVKQSLEVSDNALNLLFENYKDPDVDIILTEGIERLCLDLNYQPDEFAILVLAWCLDASQMCQFTKTEFIEGLHKMCADSIKTIRMRLEQTIEMLRVDTEMFKQLYRFTFRFGLEPDQRILSLDMAISLWKLVFTVQTPDILVNWIHFLEQHPNIRGIPKDTWNMFLNFSEQCDIYNYDDTEAWPSLFDDFVDYEKLRLNNSGEIINDNENNDWSTTTAKLEDNCCLVMDDDDNNNDHSINTPSTPTTATTTPTLTHLQKDTRIHDVL